MKQQSAKFVNAQQLFLQLQQQAISLGGSDCLQRLGLLSAYGSFLSFVEGDPGLPGDGILINTSGGMIPFGFELTQAFSLRGVTDGITVIVFPPVGTQDFSNAGIALSRSGLFDPCSISAGLLLTRTITINGVQGYVSNVSQQDLQAFVNTINQIRPQCEQTIDDLSVDWIYMYRQGAQSITTLDAAIIKRGQNAQP